MKSLRRHRLTTAVQVSLLLSMPAIAFAQDATTTSTDQSARTLDTIEVTGSRIKRTEAETSSPLYEVDRVSIDKTGALTIGDFIQDIPAVAGTAANPQVNNGGGTGAATIALRGLSDKRTLVLVNGRRIVTNDVNSIPMSMVERVEVLKDGASSVYGSDAIGGVVNFILKKNYSGINATVNYGISDRNDGERTGVSSTLGINGDRGNVIISADWNNQKEVSSADRKFSHDALTLYAGVVTTGGSSRALNGRYSVPESVVGLDCNGDGDLADSAAVAHNPGADTNPTTDFHCFGGADLFNYQAVGNLELTPQERAGLFLSSTFDITDSVQGYVDAFVNKTRSASQIAPLPFDGRPGNDNVLISKDNIYNPFGVDIVDSRLRMGMLGNRRFDFSTDVDQITVGLKGAFGNSSWTWDVNTRYGKINQDQTTSGYLLSSGLVNALGPSYVDATGPHCGVPGAPIAGCVPLDVFHVPIDTSTPAGQTAAAAFAALSVNSHTSLSQWNRGLEANFAGDLFDVSAGTVQGAFGLAYSKSRLEFKPDYLSTMDLSTFTCQISSEACASVAGGDVTIKELYGEVLAPLTHTLQLSLGARYSKFSNDGQSNGITGSTSSNTFKGKLGLEWRPNEQWLVRGTYAQVFRDPTLTDLYQGYTAFSAGFTDPCNQYTGPANGNPACTNVPTDGSFHQTDTQLSAFVGGTPTLKPEHGTVQTLGFIYEPSWFSGFSTSVDLWRVKIEDTIQNYGTQVILNDCFNSTTADPSPLCSRFTRDANGEIIRLFDPTGNVGTTSTQGVDFGVKYNFDTDWGKFRASVDSTYIDKYDIEQTFNGLPIGTLNDAGTYMSAANGGLGNYSRLRALGNLGWSMGNWDVQWTTRFVSGFTVGSLDLDGVCASLALPPGSPECQFHRGGQVYHNIEAGWRFDPWGLKVRAGVDNAFDKQPPILYQNNTLNGNTDETNFDTVGRYYWTTISVDFK